MREYTGNEIFALVCFALAWLVLAHCYNILMTHTNKYTQRVMHSSVRLFVCLSIYRMCDRPIDVMHSKTDDKANKDTTSFKGTMMKARMLTRSTAMLTADTLLSVR